MHAIRGIAVMAVLALAGPAHAASDKKAVEKTVKAQVTSLLGYDDGYASTGAFTTGHPSLGVVDGAGLRLAMKDYVKEWGWVHAIKVQNLKVAFHDAGDAWASFTVHVGMVEDEAGDAPASFDLRAVELLTTGDDGAWKVVAGHWAKPVLDKAAKVMAEKGQLGVLIDLGGTTANDELGELIELLGSGGIATRISTRADVAVFGTDAMKQRLGGKKTQKAWKSWWKAVKVEGATASGMSDSGEVGWIAANLTIQKGKVSIPARVFLVVAAEKGLLRVVAAEISVAQLPD